MACNGEPMNLACDGGEEARVAVYSAHFASAAGSHMYCPVPDRGSGMYSTRLLSCDVTNFVIERGIPIDKTGESASSDFQTMTTTTEARAPPKISTLWTRWGAAKRATVPPPKASSNFVTAKVSASVPLAICGHTQLRGTVYHFQCRCTDLCESRRTFLLP